MVDCEPRRTLQRMLGTSPGLRGMLLVWSRTRSPLLARDGGAGGRRAGSTGRRSVGSREDIVTDRLPTIETMAARFGRVWEPSTDGARWYASARRDAARIGKATDTPTDTVAAVIAACSPRVQWSTNLKMAANMCAIGDCSGLGTSRRNAARILSGESPDDVLQGPKVHAFYRAISGDLDAAVVDVWMLRAAGWPKDAVSRREYADVARALTRAARRFGRDTAVFQAETWVAVRGRHD
jgi:hypothetical protein